MAIHRLERTRIDFTHQIVTRSHTKFCSNILKHLYKTKCLRVLLLAYLSSHVIEYCNHLNNHYNDVGLIRSQRSEDGTSLMESVCRSTGQPSELLDVIYIAIANNTRRCLLYICCCAGVYHCYKLCQILTDD